MTPTECDAINTPECEAHPADIVEPTVNIPTAYRSTQHYVYYYLFWHPRRKVVGEGYATSTVSQAEADSLALALAKDDAEKKVFYKFGVTVVIP